MKGLSPKRLKLTELSTFFFMNTLVQFKIFISARVQNIRDFPKTKLVSEIKSSFSLENEHGDPHFLFYKFNENNIRNN